MLIEANKTWLAAITLVVWEVVILCFVVQG